MPVSIPPTLRTILQDKAYGHVVTRNANGSPQVSMTWVDAEGDEVLVNTNDARLKAINLKRDPRVIVSVQDRNNPQSFAVFYGRAKSIVNDANNAHIDKLSKRFLGLDKYQSRVPGEQRVVIRISVDKIGGFAPGYQPWA
jgi:PPOX class probable F420-dependent enzyme